MKKFAFLLVGLLILCNDCYAISLAGASIPSGLLLQNTHVHVSTIPSKVKAVTITAKDATNNFVCLIQTTDPQPDNVNYVSKGKVLADLVVSVANDTVHFVWPDGVACGGNLFVDLQNADGEVYYEE